MSKAAVWREDLTIPDLLDGQAASNPNALFAIFPDCEVTFGQMREEARAFAKSLLGVGVRPGDHVALLMPNCRDFLAPYFGCLMIGAVVVALNARYKRHDLAYALPHSDSKAVIMTDAISDYVDFVGLLNETLPSLRDQKDARALALPEAPLLKTLILLGSARAKGFLSRDDLAAAGRNISDAHLGDARRTPTPDSTAVIMYTSGTTAAPKACELTHRGIQNSWRTFSNLMDLSPGQKLWTPMPLFHTGGVGPMAACLERGAAFMTTPHYNPETLLDLIERHRIEHLYAGFPPLSLPLVDSPRFTHDRFSFVKSMVNVGPEPIQRHIQERLPPGAVLLNLFGMTEGSGIVTFTPPDLPFAVRAVSSGLTPAGTETRIADAETNAVLGPNQIGEIQFRGGGAFKKYYKDPAATAATILEGGWVRTGDQGRMTDDGQLYFLGRLKDVLKVGGENVGALEIESFLLKHPGVAMAQVVAAPDARMGEVPVAFVERAPGSNVTAEELAAHCDGQLARWKIPRDFVFVAEWPMSSTKIQKFRLREQLPEKYRAQA